MQLEPSGTPIPLDPKARAQLANWVAQHWDGVFALLYRLAGNRHEAEDLTQETFLRASQRRDSFKTGTNLRAWLMRIATNAFLDGRRRKRTSNVMPLMDDTAESAPGPNMALEHKELGKALEVALAELPETARAVFLLRTREDLSFREIGEAIGATEKTARWHMLQARRKLMQSLTVWT